MNGPAKLAHSFVYPDGVERVLHDVRAAEILPALLGRYGWSRVAIVCSASLRRGTGVVQAIEAALAGRVVLVWDLIGEHSPVGNVLAGTQAVRDAGADVLLSIGGGSVIDFCKFVQMCMTEDVRDRVQIKRLAWRMDPESGEIRSATQRPPVIRHIAIPTTLATAEWTPGGTPLDEVDRQKLRLMGPQGAPIAIVYDPEIMSRTPLRLLVTTAIRGLDHAINTACATRHHPLATLLTEKAIGLYLDNLPRIVESADDLGALSNLQFATWTTGMCQVAMSGYHGFSHWMVHVLAPLASVGHSDLACVLMLAQARWFEPVAGDRYDELLRAVGRPAASVPALLEALLKTLRLPTTLADLNIDEAAVEASIPLALAHPLVTRSNLRPIRTAADVRAVLALAGPVSAGR